MLVRIFSQKCTKARGNCLVIVRSWVNQHGNRTGELDHIAMWPFPLWWTRRIARNMAREQSNAVHLIDLDFHRNVKIVMVHGEEYD